LNAWSELAAIFCRTRDALLEHEQAKAELKGLMPEDAKEASGHGIRAKRSKSGAVSFDLLSVEDMRCWDSLRGSVSSEFRRLTAWPVGRKPCTAPRREPQAVPPPSSRVAFCVSANLPNFALNRLSRYEATLWRQAGQILFALDALDRRKPHERRRRFHVGGRQELPFEPNEP
jgi:hypothetical protein